MAEERETEGFDKVAELVTAVVADAEEVEDLLPEEERLFLRHPPPTGTFRRAPPRVQYRRQALQKWRGCERL